MISKTSKKRSRVARWLSLLGIIIFTFLTVFSFVSTKRMYTGFETLYWERDNVLPKLFTAAAVLLICWLIGKGESVLTEKRVHIAAILASVLASAFCVFLAREAGTRPQADQWYVYVATEGLFYRDYTYLQKYVYYTVCPYQLGLAQVYALIARIAGTLHHEVLHYAQSLCVGACVYFIYRIGKELFRNVTAQCLCILFSLAFLPMMLYSQFLYGETIGVCMALVCIFFFLAANRSEGQARWRRNVYWAVAVAAFGLVYLVRPALIVVWIAIAMIQLCLCQKKKNFLPMLFVVLMLLAGISTQKLVVGYVGRTAGVKVDNGMPVAPLTIAMGMQDDDPNNTGPGSYNAYNYNLFAETGNNRQEATRRALHNMNQILHQWLRDPGRMCRLFFHKALNQWTEPGYDAFTMTYIMESPAAWVESLYYNDLHTFAYGWLDCFQTLSYAMLAFWFWHLFRSGHREDVCVQDYLIGLILIGEFFFSLLWEASCRYIYPYMVIIIPCVAGSSAYCYQWLRAKRRGLKKADGKG